MKKQILSILCLACLAYFADTSFSLAGEPRSAQWERVRAEHLAQEAYCALCGTTNSLEVHHVQAFHARPDMELVATNLLTLCRHCHFEAGHLGNWTNNAPQIRQLVGDVGKRLHMLRTNAGTRRP